MIWQAVKNYRLTVATEQAAEFVQEQNRKNLEEGERYDERANGENSEKDSPGLVGERNTKRSGSGLSKTESAKNWKEIGREQQEQVIRGNYERSTKVEFTPAQKHLVRWLKIVGCSEDETIGIMLAMDTPMKRDRLMSWMAENRRATPQDILRITMDLAAEKN